MNKKARDNYTKLLSEYPVGARVHRLTVSGLPYREVVSEKGVEHWHLPVRCDCGKKLGVTTSHLRRGTTSCGCARVDRIGALNYTYGFRSHPIIKRLYALHGAVKGRTLKDPAYIRNGIKMTPEWAEDRDEFIRWSLCNGYAPGLILDRIDNSKGYEPDNCRYVDDLSSARNRTSSRFLEVHGIIDTVAGHCRRLGLRYSTVHGRLNAYGWDVGRAFSMSTPEQDTGSYIYLAVNPDAHCLSVGRTSSVGTRKKKLKACGFQIVNMFPVASSSEACMIEFLMYEHLKKLQIPGGACGKSKKYDSSRETFFISDAIRCGFKFKKAFDAALEESPVVVQTLKELAAKHGQAN